MTARARVLRSHVLAHEHPRRLEVEALRDVLAERLHRIAAFTASSIGFVERQFDADPGDVASQTTHTTWRRLLRGNAGSS
jgi:hypothetical protein